ncbi:MAG: rRNA maturation RNase YbeY [Betaproteobacteria bacterium RBG_16_58_11]|nr:MAG: rRNA maturation RNase YbeY [Betaproteobacteria bacterium RBG_16_58_11]
MPTNATKKTKQSRGEACLARTPPRLSLAVQYAAEAAGLPTRAQVRKWARAALTCDAEITVRFVDEIEGRSLNRDYRGKDYATNVLSFIYSSTPVQGDLVICAPVVAREAQDQGKAIDAHYAHLIVHGALHLQGFDHEVEAEAQAMEARETEIVIKLGYPDPY